MGVLLGRLTAFAKVEIRANCALESGSNNGTLTTITDDVGVHRFRSWRSRERRRRLGDSSLDLSQESTKKFGKGCDLFGSQRLLDLFGDGREVGGKGLNSKSRKQIGKITDVACSLGRRWQGGGRGVRRC